MLNETFDKITTIYCLFVNKLYCTQLFLRKWNSNADLEKKKPHLFIS